MNDYKPHIRLLLALVSLLLSAGVYAKDMFYYIGNEMIQVIDGDSDAIVADIPVDGWLRDSEFSADKKFLFAVANRHILTKVDLAANRVVATADVNSDGWDRFIYGFDLAPDGKTAYVILLSRKTRQGEAVVGTPQLAQIDIGDGHIIRSIDVPWSSVSIATVKNASEVLVIGKDIVKVDTSRPEMRTTGTYPMFSKHWNILPLWDYTDENGGVYMVNYYTPDVMGLLSIDTKTGKISDMPLDGPPVFAYSVIRSPDKKKVYAVMDELSVIDLASHSYDAVIPLHTGTAYAVNISSDGKKVYTTGGGSVTTIFDTRTLKPVKVLQMQTDGMDLRRLTY